MSVVLGGADGPFEPVDTTCGAGGEAIQRFLAGCADEHDARPEEWHEQMRTWKWGRDRGKDTCRFCGVPLGPYGG